MLASSKRIRGTRGTTYMSLQHAALDSFAFRLFTSGVTRIIRERERESRPSRSPRHHMPQVTTVGRRPKILVLYSFSSIPVNSHESQLRHATESRALVSFDRSQGYGSHYCLDAGFWMRTLLG